MDPVVIMDRWGQSTGTALRPMAAETQSRFFVETGAHTPSNHWVVCPDASNDHWLGFSCHLLTTGVWACRRCRWISEWREHHRIPNTGRFSHIAPCRCDGGRWGPYTDFGRSCPVHAAFGMWTPHHPRSGDRYVAANVLWVPPWERREDDVIIGGDRRTAHPGRWKPGKEPVDQKHLVNLLRIGRSVCGL